MYMDTDSLYITASSTKLHDLLAPEKRHQFYKTYHHWFPSESCDSHRQKFVNIMTSGGEWVRRDCCTEGSIQEKVSGHFCGRATEVAFWCQLYWEWQEHSDGEAGSYHKRIYD